MDTKKGGYRGGEGGTPVLHSGIMSARHVMGSDHALFGSTGLGCLFAFKFLLHYQHYYHRTTHHHVLQTVTLLLLI